MVPLDRARAYVVRVYRSPGLAENLLIEWIAAGKVQWRSLRLDGFVPKGAVAADLVRDLWKEPKRLRINWAESFVTKFLPHGRFTVYGVWVALENIEAQLPIPASADAARQPSAEPAPGELSPSADVSNARAKLPEAPRPPSLGRQRTETILRKLYPNKLPPEHSVATADIITAIKGEWRVVPNPQHVRLPSDNTLRDVIKDRREAEKQRAS